MNFGVGEGRVEKASAIGKERKDNAEKATRAEIWVIKGYHTRL